MPRRISPSILLTVLVGVVLSAVVAVHVSRTETRTILEEFDLSVTTRIRQLNREIDLNLEALRSLKHLHEIGGRIERSHFLRFASQTLERHSDIQALEWVPRVSHDRRSEMERARRQTGYEGFQFTERSPDGRMIRAADREEYFPVYFLAPEKGNESALGYDLGSDAARLATLHRSRDSGKMRATCRVVLVQEPSDQFGVLVALPVYGGEPPTVERRRAELAGFLLAVYRVGEMFEKAVQLTAPLDPDVEIALIDDDGRADERELYRRKADPRGKPVPHLTVRKKVGPVAERTWTLEATPTDAYVVARRSLQPQAAFLVGLVMTGLGAAFIRITIGRGRRIRHLVDLRTQELTQANEELERQRNILRALLDSLGDGVAFADETGRLTMLNPAAERILGMGLIEEKYDKWTEVYGLYRPDGVTPMPPGEMPLARAVGGEETRDVEMFVRNPARKGGVYIRVTASPLKDPSGNAKGGVAIFRDINERKWAEALLRDSEARFRSIVEATATAVIILGRDHRILEFNPKAEQIFGLGRADALGKDFLDLCLPSEFHDAVAADVLRALAGESTPGFETPVQGQGGKERTMLWSFSLLSEAEGRPPAIIAGGVDITERREADDARRVRELAAHLQSAREYERRHIAREIHDELGQALTGLKLQVSHISKHAGDEPAALRGKLAELGGMIDGTIRSVRQLATELRPQLIDELGLIEAIEWQAQEFEKRTGIACSVDLPEGELDWNQDQAIAVFRIVQESLTNVARHAGAKRASVHMRQDEDRVLLEINDDGRGITEVELRNSTSFGLLGMRERARMLGGKVSIEGREGEGTTVTITMPR